MRKADEHKENLSDLLSDVNLHELDKAMSATGVTFRKNVNVSTTTILKILCDEIIISLLPFCITQYRCCALNISQIVFWLLRIKNIEETVKFYE